MKSSEFGLFTSLISCPSPPYDRDFVFQVLRDRKPDWIAQWVNKELEDEDSYPDWQLVRKLIREGVCPKPNSEAYVLKFLLIASFIPAVRRL